MLWICIYHIIKNNHYIANILSFTLSKVFRTKIFLGALAELLFEKYKLMHFNEHLNIFSIHWLGLGCNYPIIPGWVRAPKRERINYFLLGVKTSKLLQLQTLNPQLRVHTSVVCNDGSYQNPLLPSCCGRRLQPSTHIYVTNQEQTRRNKMEKNFINISDYVNIKHLYSSLTYKYHVISYTVYQIITRFITLIISLVIPSTYSMSTFRRSRLGAWT